MLAARSPTQPEHHHRTPLPHRPYEPCIPSRTVIIPSSPLWVHEIKHDGFRMLVRREGDRVRLLTRNGYDWSDRYPALTEAARKLKPTSFVLDGEAVILDANGLADFDKLQSRRHDKEVKLLCFDLLAVDGVDIRPEPLRERKRRLAKLLRISKIQLDAIQLVEHLSGNAGPAMFEHACKLGAEGIVSKRLDRAYRAGRCSHWLKIKNKQHPAMSRVMETFR